MQYENDRANSAQALFPERLGNILPRVLGQIMDRQFPKGAISERGSFRKAKCERLPTDGLPFHAAFQPRTGLLFAVRQTVRWQ